MSAKEDVFAEHDLRAKLFDLLTGFQRNTEELVKSWHVDGWSRRLEMRKLRADAADDIIEVIKECQKS